MTRVSIEVFALSERAGSDNYLSQQGNQSARKRGKHLYHLDGRLLPSHENYPGLLVQRISCLCTCAPRSSRASTRRSSSCSRAPNIRSARHAAVESVTCALSHLSWADDDGAVKFTMCVSCLEVWDKLIKDSS
ncbi:hypothetical protein Q8A67_013130 [Cirrhinus molitorella]|uniref:Uncharacterized protein n=1 Tax=Cirrhinus molitorella TaxID=172907 RepID=A0AA88PQF0_9TELE|nr:hypothetical protein Q8A67_013130 [Cirrhinus molitorella]